MSTPMDDQYIPPEFQGTIGLPEQQAMDPAALKKLQEQVSILSGQGGVSQAAIQTANHRAQLIKQQLAGKMTPALRARLTAQLRQQQQIVTAQKKIAEQVGQRLPDLQNQLYKATGQYDKLLTGENRDAFMALQTLFNGYGLGSLAGRIFDYVKQGYQGDTISILLQDTPEYKARFAGNEARRKAGLAVLNPADYLATEAAYRQVLSASGLPRGFYDNPADFTHWIASDVSPTEVQKRVDQAVAWTSQADPAVKSALKSMYGVDDAYVVAYALDQSRALPLLQKQARAAEIGAAAVRRGFAASRQDFEGLATYGITGQQAEQGFSQIADTYQSMQGIAQRFGLTWDQQQAEQEVFTPGVGSAVQTGKRLRSQERALFSGSRGASVQGLNAGYSQT